MVEDSEKCDKNKKKVKKINKQSEISCWNCFTSEEDADKEPITLPQVREKHREKLKVYSFLASELSKPKAVSLKQKISEPYQIGKKIDTEIIKQSTNKLLPETDIHEICESTNQENISHFTISDHDAADTSDSKVNSNVVVNKSLINEQESKEIFFKEKESSIQSVFTPEEKRATSVESLTRIEPTKLNEPELKSVSVEFTPGATLNEPISTIELDASKDKNKLQTVVTLEQEHQSGLSESLIGSESSNAENYINNTVDIQSSAIVSRVIKGEADSVSVIQKSGDDFDEPRLKLGSNLSPVTTSKESTFTSENILEQLKPPPEKEPSTFSQSKSSNVDYLINSDILPLTTVSKSSIAVRQAVSAYIAQESKLQLKSPNIDFTPSNSFISTSDNNGFEEVIKFRTEITPEVKQATTNDSSTQNVPITIEYDINKATVTQTAASKRDTVMDNTDSASNIQLSGGNLTEHLKSASTECQSSGATTNELISARKYDAAKDENELQILLPTEQEQYSLSGSLIGSESSYAKNDINNALVIPSSASVSHVSRGEADSVTVIQKSGDEFDESRLNLGSNLSSVTTSNESALTSDNILEKLEPSLEKEPATFSQSESTNVDYLMNSDIVPRTTISKSGFDVSQAALAKIAQESEFKAAEQQLTSLIVSFPSSGTINELIAPSVIGGLKVESKLQTEITPKEKQATTNETFTQNEPISIEYAINKTIVSQTGASGGDIVMENTDSASKIQVSGDKLAELELKSASTEFTSDATINDGIPVSEYDASKDKNKIQMVLTTEQKQGSLSECLTQNEALDFENYMNKAVQQSSTSLSDVRLGEADTVTSIQKSKDEFDEPSLNSPSNLNLVATTKESTFNRENILEQLESSPEKEQATFSQSEATYIDFLINRDISTHTTGIKNSIDESRAESANIVKESELKAAEPQLKSPYVDFTSSETLNEFIATSDNDTLEEESKSQTVITPEDKQAILKKSIMHTEPINIEYDINEATYISSNNINTDSTGPIINIQVSGMKLAEPELKSLSPEITSETTENEPSSASEYDDCNDENKLQIVLTTEQEQGSLGETVMQNEPVKVENDTKKAVLQQSCAGEAVSITVIQKCDDKFHVPPLKSPSNLSPVVTPKQNIPEKLESSPEKERATFSQSEYTDIDYPIIESTIDVQESELKSAEQELNLSNTDFTFSGTLNEPISTNDKFGLEVDSKLQTVITPEEKQTTLIESLTQNEISKVEYHISKIASTDTNACRSDIVIDGTRLRSNMQGSVDKFVEPQIKSLGKDLPCEIESDPILTQEHTAVKTESEINTTEKLIQDLTQDFSSLTLQHKTKLEDESSELGTSKEDLQTLEITPSTTPVLPRKSSSMLPIPIKLNRQLSNSEKKENISYIKPQVTPIRHRNLKTETKIPLLKPSSPTVFRETISKDHLTFKSHTPERKSLKNADKTLTSNLKKKNDEEKSKSEKIVYKVQIETSTPKEKYRIFNKPVLDKDKTTDNKSYETKKETVIDKIDNASSIGSESGYAGSISTIQESALDDTLNKSDDTKTEVHNVDKDVTQLKKNITSSLTSLNMKFNKPTTSSTLSLSPDFGKKIHAKSLRWSTLALSPRSVSFEDEAYISENVSPGHATLPRRTNSPLPHERDMDRDRFPLNRSGLQARSESMASVYSGAGEGLRGSVTVRGEVQFSLLYNYRLGALEVGVKRCRDLAPIDVKRNRSDPYVKVYLLPDKSKAGKRKTKVKKNTLSPVFEETLSFVQPLASLSSRTLWLSAWHADMFGRNDFLGEVTLPLADVVFDDPAPMWYKLHERTEQFDEQHGTRGDIIIGLKFELHDAARGKGTLHVLVKEAKNLVATKPNGLADVFCKSYLLPERGRLAKQKTSVVRRSLNPRWEHTFTYRGLTMQELATRALELSLWDRDRLASNDFMGAVRLSLATGTYMGASVNWMDSVGKEITLWQNMMQQPNLWVEGSLPLRPQLIN